MRGSYLVLAWLTWNLGGTKKKYQVPGIIHSGKPPKNDHSRVQSSHTMQWKSAIGCKICIEESSDGNLPCDLITKVKVCAKQHVDKPEKRSSINNTHKVDLLCLGLYGSQ